MPLLNWHYAAAEVQNQQASGAPVKLSTYGATVAAGIVGVLTLVEPTINAEFGSNSSPWLKVVVFSVVHFVWGAIMLADTLARKAPAPTAGDAAMVDQRLRDMEARLGEHIDEVARAGEPAKPAEPLAPVG